MAPFFPFSALALIQQFQPRTLLRHCPSEGEPYDDDWKRVQKLHTGEPFLPGLRGCRQPYDPIHVERYNAAYPAGMVNAFPIGAQAPRRAKPKRAAQSQEDSMEEEV